MALLLAAGVYQDVRTGKIRNTLTLPAIALGVLVSTAIHGTDGLLMSLEGVGLVLGLYLLFGPVAHLGGGDIKLMMAVAAIMGIGFTVWMLLFTGVGGGLVALAALIKRRVEIGRLRRTPATPPDMNSAPLISAEAGGQLAIKYAPAIAIGSLLACIFTGWR